MVKKTHEEFVQQVTELYGDEYNVKTRYERRDRHVTVIHNVCDREWTVLPNNLLRGATCLHCYRDSMFKTHEQFVNDFYNLVGDEFILLSKYTDSRKRIKIKHNIPECGHEFNAVPNALLSLGGRCRKCADRNQIKTQTEFITEVYDLVGDEYTVIGEYTGASDHILMKHNVCGNEYRVMPKNFTTIDGRRCPHCSFYIPKSNERFKIEIFEMVGEEYEVLSEYERSNIKVKMLHRDCENEYWVVPNSFHCGSRCPYCFASKGETKIRDILKINKINFIKQYRIPECKNKKPLPFDFAIFDESNNLKCLIEYDGISHFQEVEHFGGAEGFEYRQRNDQIKDKYCIENNINLIRIPYYDYENIQTILDNILKSA